MDWQRQHDVGRALTNWSLSMSMDRMLLAAGRGWVVDFLGWLLTMQKVQSVHPPELTNLESHRLSSI